MENSLIKDIGRSYIVSSLLPAIFFVCIGMLIFRGTIPSILLQRIVEDDQYYVGQWVLFAGFVFWVGFCLYRATDWTIRVYEGYYLPKFIRKPMAKSLQKWRHRKTKKIRKATTYIQQVDSNFREYINQYHPTAQLEYENLERIMSIENEAVMPTRFGNILMASELYPQEKYHMNALSFWTRLVHLLPASFKEIMEEKNNQMIFLLNSSLLSYSIGFLGLLVGMIKLPCQIFWDASLCYMFGPPESYMNVLVYLAISVVFLGVGYIIYNLALPAAEGFGLIIRSGFDLYRFELLRQMNYQIPATIEEEKTLWRDISEYMIAGNKLAWVPIEIKYFVKEELLDGVGPDARDKRVPTLPPRIIKKSYSEPPRLGRRNRNSPGLSVNVSINMKKK